CNRRYGRIELQWDREPENRPLSDRAAYVDLAAHHLNQSFADGETQTGSAIFTRGRFMFLRKFSEYVGQFFRCDADTGIFDFQMQLSLPFFLLAGYTDNKLALFRELYGIAHQIGDDLPQTQRIADYIKRQIGINFHQKRQPLA